MGNAVYFSYGDTETEYLKRKDKKLGAVIDAIGHIDRAVDPDLFSSVENNPGKKTRTGNLKDNEVQIMCNLKTRNYYVRFNRPLAALLEEKGFGSSFPVFNNITGEIYLVFTADPEKGYPLTTNGGTCRNYIFSRELIEWLLGNRGRKVEDVNEIWNISGDVSISPALVAVRIEK